MRKRRRNNTATMCLAKCVWTRPDTRSCLLFPFQALLSPRSAKGPGRKRGRREAGRATGSQSRNISSNTVYRSQDARVANIQPLIRRRRRSRRGGGGWCVDSGVRHASLRVNETAKCRRSKRQRRPASHARADLRCSFHPSDAPDFTSSCCNLRFMLAKRSDVDMRLRNVLTLFKNSL